MEQKRNKAEIDRIVANANTIWGIERMAPLSEREDAIARKYLAGELSADAFGPALIAASDRTMRWKSEEQCARDVQSLELYKRIDPETYFHGLQLMNRIDGADTYAKVQAADRILSYKSYFEMARYPSQGKFDRAHMLAIHERMFRDLYYFAGQLRDMPMQIDSVTRFVAPHRIPSALDAFFEKLRAIDCRKGLKKEQFIAHAAQRLTDINIIHPFREGNGRSKRVFFTAWAEHAGFAFDWAKCKEEEWLYADQCAFDSSRDGKRDVSYLQYLLDRAVDKIDESARER